MRILRFTAAVALAVAALIAGPGVAASNEGDDAKAAVDDESPFDKQQLLEQARAWQGVWVTSGNPHFKSAAWEVKGNTVRVYDGKAESTMEFTVIAPCMARLEGDEVTRYRSFAFADDRRLTSGATAAGLVTEDGAVACAGRDVYVRDASGCRVWTQQGFDRGFEEVECRETGTTLKFKSPDLDNWHALEKQDGLLASSLLQRRSKLESYRSFEEARAAVDRQNED